ncbi:kinase-like domain-containing protein [Rhizophagus clarus]|uniref:Kinase-like domain-containing protein n=1 Tax=Rhizophagus clarus TaxID=94130 RepID=A0A8H3LZW2_9GLOM|nr:kinase-like domain-containing protein [Rhizophagus clarus]
MRWMRTTYEKVCLKYLSQEDTDEFINKDESSLTNEICYGVSQNPITKDYILVFKNDYFVDYCEKCGSKYENTSCNNEYCENKHRWCKCRSEYLKNDFTNWTSGNGEFDILLKYLSNSQNINNKFLSEINYFIEEGYGISQDPNTKDYILILQLKYYCEKCEMRLNIDHNASNSIIFEWIPYDQFDDIKEIAGDWERETNKKVALKCLHNSQNFLDEFINKVKAYPNQIIDNILKIYGISQNPDTKDYIMVLEYAEGGNFNNYLDKNYENFDWFNGLRVLRDVFNGLSKIHQKQMIHRDLHIGNILFTKIPYDSCYKPYFSDSIFYIEFLKRAGQKYEVRDSACVSDMELCRRIGDINETNIYGVIPYVAPEVLKGKPYTQAADIYSFGMIMYVIATGRQPFINCAHDEILILNIYNGIRPEVNEQLVPKCYIDLMKRCWDSNPNNRPNSIEINEMIELFYSSLDQEFKKEQQHYEVEKQFKETQEYRKENFLSLKNNKSAIHAQAVYTSRLLNPFTKKLS